MRRILDAFCHRSFLTTLSICTTLLLSVTKLAAQTSEEKPDAGAKRVQLLQLAPSEVNFQFSDFRSTWITSETELKNFWEKNSRNSKTPPRMNVDWKRESLLAIFWPSKDDVIRHSAFVGSEIYEDGASRKMRLYFSLIKPCFGIITDASPAAFIVVDHTLGDLDGISVRTDNARAIGCY